MNVQNVSFKGYVPVTYYAKNPANDKYVPVIRDENKRKCNSFVVRNLNGTLKKNKNPQFVDFFRQYDRDYQRVPVVRSFYDKKSPTIFLITGNDVDVVDELAKPVGKAKRDSIDIAGTTKTFETKYAVDEFCNNVRAFLKKNCRQLKSADNQKLALRVYFDPKYTKQHKLKGFDFVNARFVVDENA